VERYPAGQAMIDWPLFYLLTIVGALILFLLWRIRR
jgi:uncharacterized membrane protein YhhN